MLPTLKPSTTSFVTHQTKVPPHPIILSNTPFFTAAQLPISCRTCSSLQPTNSPSKHRTFHTTIPAKFHRFHSTRPSKLPSSTTTMITQITGNQAQPSSTISSPRQSNSPTTSSTFTTPTTSPSSLKRATNSLPLLLLPHIQYAQPHYTTSPSHIPPRYHPHTICSSIPAIIFPFPIFHIWIIGADTTYSMRSNPTPLTPSSIRTDQTTPTLPPLPDQLQLSPFKQTTTLSSLPPLPSRDHTLQKSMPSSSPFSTLNSPPSLNRSSSPSRTSALASLQTPSFTFTLPPSPLATTALLLGTTSFGIFSNT